MTTSSVKATIPCEISKVWGTLLAVEGYPTWRSDVSKTEVINDKQFIEYTKDGFSTTYQVTVVEPHSRWELDLENSTVTGHWTVIVSCKGSETELNFTSSAEAKKLTLRPYAKSMLEKMYLKNELAKLVADLKKALDS